VVVAAGADVVVRVAVVDELPEVRPLDPQAASNAITVSQVERFHNS
jgi:hypothetical protein